MSILSKALIGIALALALAIGAIWLVHAPPNPPSGQTATATDARSSDDSVEQPSNVVESTALLVNDPAARQLAESQLADPKSTEPKSSEAVSTGATEEPVAVEAVPVDLADHYGFKASVFDKITQFPWPAVPRGSHTFANVPLEIGGAMILWGERNAKRGQEYPEQITGISVKRKFETLYVCHATFFEGDKGTPVYEVLLHFDDDTSASDSILCGDDVRDWFANRAESTLGPSGPRSTLAWDGDGKMGDRPQAIRFCLTAIANPQPDKEVTAIDVVSSKGPAAACILAITTGKSGLMRRTAESQPGSTLKQPEPAAASIAKPALVAPLASFLAHARPASFVLFSNDGKRLFSGGSDNLVQVWEMQTGELELTLMGHTSGVKCGALLPDAKVLVTGSWDQTVRVWDVDAGNSKMPLRGHTDTVDAIALSPDGKIIASGGSDRVFHFWNRAAREVSFTSPEQDLPVNRIAISPDGTLLATGTGKPAEWRRAGEVKLWDAVTGESLALLPGHAACVNTVVFSPDGKLLATGTAEGMLRIWDVATRAELSATNLGLGVRTIAFLGDGQTLALGQYPGQVLLWDLATRTRVLAYAGHESREAMVDHVSLSPDGSLIASAGTDGMIYFWPVPESNPDGKRRLWQRPADGTPTAAELVTKWKADARGDAPAGEPAPKK
jgi:WD40 repeat protein